MRKVQNYDIGIDIGTNSVGYAVTDEDGELIRFKKENMWGVNLFESAETAVKTRGYRCTRRRYDRRKQRINLLQEFLAEDISQKDEYFYLRLKESSLWNDDKSERINDIAALFSEKDLSETKYYEKFPTIYHLRRYLIDTTQKEDIRLIYLALHHIVKYRGNFLYEDTPNISAKNSQIEPAINNLLISLKELYDIEDIENISKEVSKILSDIKIRNSQKSIIIRDCFNEFIDEKDVSTNIAKAMVGNVADFNKIFQLETEENLKISLAQDDSDKIIELLDDTQSVVFTELKKVYSAYILSKILKGDNTKYLSDAMIDIYDEHKKDLKVLKRLFKGYFKDEYYNMFRGEKEDNTYKKTKGKTYTNYILSSKDCTRTELCNKIRIILDSKKDELLNNNDYKYCIERLDSEVFLKKINSTDNGAIPFQLQMEEMKAIIENQSKYYECLKKNEDKLLSIVKFRIPYYVGPLNEKFNPINGQRKFAWATRIVQDKKIYPWNFEEIINIDDSAEKFIRRMTNRCTYLPEKDVIPKNSLLYSEFTVRNEIKQIKVNGIFLDLELQKELYEELFCNQKSVSLASLKNWLIIDKKYPKKIDEITGFQKENSFASSLCSYIDFKKIFNEINDENFDKIEKLILWITLFEDKKILKRKIKREMPEMTDKQIEKIAKLRYSGWSRLSKELLTEIKSPDENGKIKSIIEIMRDEKLNFMQIITSDKFEFKKKIAEAARIPDLTEITAKTIENLPASPAVKRGVLQSSNVVQEIVQIMRTPPKNIFLEFAREDDEKSRTKSRKKILDEKFLTLKKNPEFLEIINELKSQDDKGLNDRMVYLYYIQNGKSMYSGKPLHLDRLSQECQIDHIIPQSYIKDDSFDNIVLVLSNENQEKENKTFLDKEIIQKMRPMWNLLFENQLISAKKIKNLTRTDSISNEEMAGFINRQLVETRQITKHVANLFGSIYKDSNIIEIKADLSSNIRKQYGFYKNREVNDYHHAHDAYLAAVMGRYISICYPKFDREFNFFNFMKSLKGKEFSISNKVKYGITAGVFSKIKVDTETGEVIWNGEEEIKRIRKYLEYKDCFISKKLIELTGEFYKETIMPKSKKANASLIPIKKGFDVSKYGGYTGVNKAYSVILEFDGKKKREKKLVGVPVEVVKMLSQNENSIIEYFESKGMKNAKILKDRILKYQRINYDGDEFYLSSSDEIHTAKQLVLNSVANEIVYKMNNPKLKNDVTDKDLIILYEILCDKIDKNFKCFKSTRDKLVNAKNTFDEKEKQDKINIINEILKMLHANASNGNFEKYNIGNLKSREGRMGGKNLNVDKIIFINTSVTGMFQNKTYGKDLK